jgi:hypothetical protein
MSKRLIEKRYIEIVGSVAAWRIDLSLWNVFCIGEFTRENVSDWLANYASKHHGLDAGWWPEDFHAVCGEQDIPWLNQEACDLYNGRPTAAALRFVGAVEGITSS